MASKSLPSRGAWIEITPQLLPSLPPVSLPSRGAWIEIAIEPPSKRELKVAPLAGSVDRNSAVEPLLPLF